MYTWLPHRSIPQAIRVYTEDDEFDLLLPFINGVREAARIDRAIRDEIAMREVMGREVRDRQMAGLLASTAPPPTALAEALLLRHLDADQRADYDATGGFYVETTYPPYLPPYVGRALFRIYPISPWAPYRVGLFELDPNYPARVRSTHCVYALDGHLRGSKKLPLHDQALVFAVALQTVARGFWDTTIRQVLHRHVPPYLSEYGVCVPGGDRAQADRRVRELQRQMIPGGVNLEFGV